MSPRSGRATSGVIDPMTKPSPNFTKTLASIGRNEVVVPALRSALWKPDFKSFTVTVDGFEERPPDGWFHPSTHPLWNEVMLYYYMTNYERMIRDPFDHSSTLAVTAGTFFHTFVQNVLVEENVLELQPEVCGCGRKHPERAEVYLVDEESKSRGHSDGVVFEGSGFEFKTMNPMKLGRVPKGGPTEKVVLDWFKNSCSDYYAQAQEYLRLSGRERMIVVILALTYPFEIREIHVPYDRPYAYGVRDKFKRVIQAVADGQPPRCQCAPTDAKSCPARGVCQMSSDDFPFNEEPNDSRGFYA